MTDEPDDIYATKSFEFWIDLKRPIAPAITNIQTSVGSTVVHWEKLPEHNDDSFTIENPADQITIQYQVCYRATGEQDYLCPLKPTSYTSMEVSNLESGVETEFIIYAIDEAGNQSDYSLTATAMILSGAITGNPGDPANPDACNNVVAKEDHNNITTSIVDKLDACSDDKKSSGGCVLSFQTHESGATPVFIIICMLLVGINGRRRFRILQCD
jgi:hypothetical protein